MGQTLKRALPPVWWSGSARPVGLQQIETTSEGKTEQTAVIVRGVFGAVSCVASVSTGVPVKESVLVLSLTRLHYKYRNRQ